MRRNRLAVVLTGSAVLACLIAGVLLSRTPIMRGGRPPTLVEVSGMIAVPALAAAVAAWAAWHRRPVVLSIGAAIVGLFSLVTGFSFGRVFLPAAGLLVAGAVASFAGGAVRKGSAE